MQNREVGHSEPRLSQMQIIIQPPREARPGDILSPPLTICLRTLEDSEEAERLMEDLGNYWASISVVSEDGMIALAPPSTTLMSGTLVDSVREADQTEDERETGYLLFQNVSIHQRGNFRLRVSLMQMSSRDPASNACGSDTRSSGAINIGSVVTHVIHVYDCAPVAHIGQSPYIGQTEIGLFADNTRSS